MMRVSCIIPAYNEATRIAHVLGAVSGHPLIDEIIVVDDGSKDATGTIVQSFPQVTVLRHDRNQGKSAAVCTGLAHASSTFVLFLDSDLVGLTPDDITVLVAPVLHAEALMSMSLRKNTPWLWKLIGLDFISGERVLPKILVEKHVDAIAALPGFGLEVFLNRLIIQAHYTIKVVRWDSVMSPYKYKKYGFWHGVKSDLKMLRDMFAVISPWEAVTQIAYMRFLRVK